MPLLFEACVDSWEGVERALAARVDRLELCSRLDLDGLSPEAALLERVLGETELPVHAMVRPREGDFVYTEEELAAMEGECRQAARRGLPAVVLGVLTRGGEIDAPALQRLVRAARPCAVTFHRAFDALADPFAGLETLVDLGVERVLTSGCAPTAWEGREVLRGLVQRAGGRITLLAGGGVRAHNARRLVEATGVAELHASEPFRLP